MSPSFLKLNPHLAGKFGKPPEPAKVAGVRTNITVQKSNEEDGLNSFERAYLAHLRMLQYPWIGVQAFKLRLAYNTHYTPDFVFLNFNGELEAHETKGFMRDDAAVKIKVAARMYPIIRFVLVTRKNKEWQWQPITP